MHSSGVECALMGSQPEAWLFEGSNILNLPRSTDDDLEALYNLFCRRYCVYSYATILVLMLYKAVVLFC